MSQVTERTLAGGRRREILTILQGSSTPLSIVEIARRIDVHPNTARFHLVALTERGRAERATPVRSGPGRPPQLFQARRGMDPEGPRSYRLLATVLAGGLAGAPDSATRVLDAGRAWGRELAARSEDRSSDPDDPAATGLLRLLDELGFAPELRTDGDERAIGLRHCPFLELVEHQADVICPLHLGLMQGVMEQLGGGGVVESLEPFVEPDLCVAHLSVE